VSHPPRGRCPPGFSTSRGFPPAPARRLRAGSPHELHDRSGPKCYPVSRGPLPFRVLTTAGSAGLRETAAPSGLLAPLPRAANSESDHGWLMVSPRCCGLVAKPPRQQFAVAGTLAGALRFAVSVLPGIHHPLSRMKSSQGGSPPEPEPASPLAGLSPADESLSWGWSTLRRFQNQSGYRLMGSAIPLRRSSGLEVFPALEPSVRRRKPQTLRLP